jgi:hypothetical protein
MVGIVRTKVTQIKIIVMISMFLCNIFTYNDNKKDTPLLYFVSTVHQCDVIISVRSLRVCLSNF